MTIKLSKIIIAHKSTTLIGWEFSDQAWRPSKHKVNPLQTAPEPVTVKQMRSWLGAAKQLSAGPKDYARIFYPLEQFAAGKQSGHKVEWSELLSSSFKTAQNLLGTL